MTGGAVEESNEPVGEGVAGRLGVDGRRERVGVVGRPSEETDLPALAGERPSERVAQSWADDGRAGVFLLGPRERPV
ncbi:hypothetical protein [Halomarina oriensis]|uniref:Uncharacterized protein n=1 Tax=Halomarina oriensis TaxID=671145 RepID=A0A6B0GQM2_9EURY|nr:hypothetical protein [Halomarina oriensis]MWG34425.1 hypothetical protein [Halomarina oriensis]